MHRDVDALPRAVEVEGREGQPRAPGVVERGHHAARAAHIHQRGQVGKLHRHRAGRLDPHQPRAVRQLGREVGRVHGVVHAVRDAEVRELARGQRLVGSIGIVGNEHLVAGLQEGEGHQRDGREAAGHQQAFGAPFERRQPLLEREGGRRAVQAVGVAGLGLPVARAHRGHVGKEHGRCLVHAGLRRGEGGGRCVGMVDQVGGGLAHGFDASALPHGRNPQVFYKNSSCV